MMATHNLLRDHLAIRSQPKGDYRAGMFPDRIRARIGRTTRAAKCWTRGSSSSGRSLIHGLSIQGWIKSPRKSLGSPRSLVLVALALICIDCSVQAAFAPADSAALRAAIGTCNSTGCTGGCLGETTNGTCPTFAASNDTTGNPYGVMGDWDVSQVTNLDSSTFTFHLFIFLFTCLSRP